ncbi:MAG: DUF1287 domain-containing protein [Acidobacteriota bacterium]
MSRRIRPGAAGLLAALLALHAGGQEEGGAAREKIAAVLAAARSQIGVTTVYDGSYRRLPYPGGDLPAERGVCTDVLVRAFRAAGVDLQRLVHEDMTRAFSDYPNLWGLAGPDPNIDHRRVPNLLTYFRRQGASVPVTDRPSDYLAGDVVTWRLPSGLPHIGLVSSARAPGTDRPLVLHNIGRGTREEDVLFAYVLTGHFRYFR